MSNGLSFLKRETGLKKKNICVVLTLLLFKLDFLLVFILLHRAAL